MNEVTGTEKQVVKQSEMNNCLSAQMDSIITLEQTVERLWERLNPVLHQTTIGEVPLDEEKAIDVPLIRELDNRTQRIVRCNNELLKMLDLCEL